MFSKRFMLFPTFKKKIGVKKQKSGGGGVNKFRGGGGGVEKKIFRRIIISHFTFYAIFNIKKNTIEKVPLHLMVKWEVVSPNSR